MSSVGITFLPEISPLVTRGKTTTPDLKSSRLSYFE